MTDNDFRAAVDVQIIRWRFDQMVEREFEQSDVPTGLVALLAPHDTASALDGRGGSETGAR